MKFRMSMPFEAASGKDKNVVAIRSRVGTVLRSVPFVKNPNTELQQESRGYLRQATAAYRGLTASQVASWRTYAKTIVVKDSTTGKDYSPTASNVFIGLAAKFLQNNPTGTIPLTPPASSFAGDQLKFTVTNSTGTITVTATAPNSAGVVTELLIQPLKTATNEAFLSAYRHAKFFTFATGSLSTDIEVEPGNYSVAVRFVKASTGQVTEIRPLPTQVVTFSVAAGDKQKKAA